MLDLVIWFYLMTFSWTVAGILSDVLVGICMIRFLNVIQLGISIWSAFALKNRLDEAIPDSRNQPCGASCGQDKKAEMG